MDREIVSNYLESEFDSRVFTVEDGTVWVSGMNSHCPTIARRMAKTLTHGYDIPTSLVYDDGADRFGGVEFRFGANA